MEGWVNDATRSWLVCLLPRFFWRWLWSLDLPLGNWAPHVFGRVVGVDGERVRNSKETHEERDTR